MKKINNIRNFTLRLLLVCGVLTTAFSTAEAQRHGGGGGRGFSGGRISGGFRGGFGGGNRIASVPHYAPGRVYGGIRGSINIGPAYRGYYGRPYYGGVGVYGRPYYGYGAYYRGYYPHIGFRINILPYGYYPFYFGGYPYYYNEGLFYRQYADGGDYQVVAPPVGAEIPRLPRGAQDITIDGQQYFEKDGVYYQPIVNQDGKKVYRVAGKDGVLNTDGNGTQVAPPEDQQPYNNGNTNMNNSNTNLPRVGDVVNSIPADSRKVTINGEKLFVSPDGVYYQEDNSGNSRIYKVVGAPSADGGTDAVYN